MEFGFGFHWQPYSSPYLILPDGGKIRLDTYHILLIAIGLHMMTVLQPLRLSNNVDCLNFDQCTWCAELASDC